MTERVREEGAILSLIGQSLLKYMISAINSSYVPAHSHKYLVGPIQSDPMPDVSENAN